MYCLEEERLRVDARRQDAQRKEVVKNKRAAANGPSAASKPRLSMIPEVPAASLSKGSLRAAAKPGPGDPKGKGKEPATLAATLKGGRRLITPDAEGDMDWQDSAHPGPRPQPSKSQSTYYFGARRSHVTLAGDSINDGVVEEEWKRQLLIWYLCHRDRKPIPLTTDYDDLKRVLAIDPNWDSDDETLGDRLYEAEYPTEVGLYDEEPLSRKPVLVSLLPTIQPLWIDIMIIYRLEHWIRQYNQKARHHMARRS